MVREKSACDRVKVLQVVANCTSEKLFKNIQMKVLVIAPFLILASIWIPVGMHSIMFLNMQLAVTISLLLIGLNYEQMQKFITFSIKLKKETFVSFPIRAYILFIQNFFFLINRYVHYEVDQSGVIDHPQQLTSESSLTPIVPCPPRLDDRTILFPPQWIQCDLRFLDMSILGEDHLFLRNIKMLTYFIVNVRVCDYV